MNVIIVIVFDTINPMGFNRLFFNLMYLGKPPWDSGVSPPELLEYMQAHPPGQALDLGCGTGTNVITLAKAGWQATGVDYTGRAIRKARRKAKQAGVEADLEIGDVTRLEGITGPFDLILDLGCFHTLTDSGMKACAASVERLLAPGGTYILYAFIVDTPTSGPGITEADLGLFSGLHLERKELGSYGPKRSAWFWFRKENL